MSATGGPAAPAAAPRPFILRVGLTGGIATGKSTIGRIFSGLGASVVDADEIAHALIERGAPAYERVVQAFGNDILRPDGSIHRAALARVIFSDTDRRARLEEILHPLIREEEAARIERLVVSGQGRIIVSNAALLVETGAYRDYHRVVLVSCDPGVQIERILRRDSLSEEEARIRIAAQMPFAEKKKVAHYLIDTTGGYAPTETRARAVFRHLQLDLQALAELT